MQLSFSTFLLTALMAVNAVAYSSVSQNQVPRCFQNPNVDPVSPYLVVLFDIDKNSANRIVQALMKSAVVKVDSVQGSLFYIISLSPDRVNVSSTRAVDKKVAQTVHSIVGQNLPYGSTYTYSCNEISEPFPKAGGMNGNN